MNPELAAMIFKAALVRNVPLVKGLISELSREEVWHLKEEAEYVAALCQEDFDTRQGR